MSTCGQVPRGGLARGSAALVPGAVPAWLASRLTGSGGDAGVVLTQVSDLWARRHGRARDAWVSWPVYLPCRGVRARHDQAIINLLS